MIWLKKYVYNSKIKNIEHNLLDTTNLTTNTTFDARINKIKTKYIALITKLELLLLLLLKMKYLMLVI